MTPSCIGVCCWDACGWGWQGVGGGGGGSEERGGEGEGLWSIFQVGVSSHCKPWGGEGWRLGGGGS